MVPSSKKKNDPDITIYKEVLLMRKKWLIAVVVVALVGIFAATADGT
ncbi:MAG: hypothetical protein IMW94_03175 [Thermoanaerobacter sp.]|nr:hypothetical protein [Thermoanaerobacter sp.]